MKDHTDKSKAIGRMLCGWMRSKQNFLACMKSVWQKTNAAFQHKDFNPFVKCSAGIRFGPPLLLLDQDDLPSLMEP